MSESRAPVPLPLAYLHPAGHVKAICGGTVCLAVGDIHEHETVSPQQQSGRIAELQKKRADAQVPPYNLCGSIANNADVVIMRLDAPFSAKKDARALFDVQHLGRVTAHLWGAIQLADGNWYAYCLKLGCYLHEFILGLEDCSLLTFRQPNNTLNCMRSNMEAINSATLAAALQPEITDIKPHGKQGSRWVVRWQQGGKSKSFTRKLEQKQEVEDMHRILLEIQSKQALSSQLWSKRFPTAPRAEPQRSDFFSRNTIAPDKEKDGVHLGPWLKGVVEEHCSKVWCIRWSGKPHAVFQHFATQEEAHRKLLEVNLAHPWDGNPWAVDARSGHRVIYLSHVSAIYIPDNPALIAALAKHRWKPEYTNRGGYRAINADEKTHDEGNPLKYASGVIQTVLEGLMQPNEVLAPVSNEENDFTGAAVSVLRLKSNDNKKRKRKESSAKEEQD